MKPRCALEDKTNTSIKRLIFAFLGEVNEFVEFDLQTLKHNAFRLKRFFTVPPYWALYLNELSNGENTAACAGICAASAYILVIAPVWQYPLLLSLVVVLMSRASYGNKNHNHVLIWNHEIRGDPKDPHTVVGKMYKAKKLLTQLQKYVGKAATVLEKCANALDGSDKFVTMMTLTAVLVAGMITSIFLFCLGRVHLSFARLLLMGICYHFRPLSLRKNIKAKAPSMVTSVIDRRSSQEIRRESQLQTMELTSSALKSTTGRGWCSRVVERLYNFYSRIPDSNEIDHRYICRQQEVAAEHVLGDFEKQTDIPECIKYGTYLKVSGIERKIEKLLSTKFVPLNEDERLIFFFQNTFSSMKMDINHCVFLTTQRFFVVDGLQLSFFMRFSNFESAEVVKSTITTHLIVKTQNHLGKLIVITDGNAARFFCHKLCEASEVGSLDPIEKVPNIESCKKERQIHDLVRHFEKTHANRILKKGVMFIQVGVMRKWTERYFILTNAGLLGYDLKEITRHKSPRISCHFPICRALVQNCNQNSSSLRIQYDNNESCNTFRAPDCTTRDEWTVLLQELIRDSNSVALPTEIGPSDRGVLQIAFWFYPTSQTLRVNIVQARNLPAMDRNGLSDPYIKVGLEPPMDQEIKTTQTMIKTLNPVYEEVIDFNINQDDLGDTCLRFDVLDWDFESADDRIGSVNIPLHSVTSVTIGSKDSRPPHPEWYSIIKVEDTKVSGFKKVFNSVTQRVGLSPFRAIQSPSRQSPILPSPISSRRWATARGGQLRQEAEAPALEAFDNHAVDSSGSNHLFPSRAALESPNTQSPSFIPEPASPMTPTSVRFRKRQSPVNNISESPLAPLGGEGLRPPPPLPTPNIQSSASTPPPTAPWPKRKSRLT